MLDRLLVHYSKWCEGDEQEESRCVEFLENTCFALSIPIVEAAYAMYVVRDGITAYISSGDDCGRNESTPQVSQFFDVLVRDLLRKY